MTQEDKQLLLKDISARVPYKVKFQNENIPTPNVATLDMTYLRMFEIREGVIFKPYLRPMSSMTKEEKRELLKFGAVNYDSNEEVIDVCCIGFDRHADAQDWLLAHHFDYRGLIEKSLAIVAPEGMYKTE